MRSDFISREGRRLGKNTLYFKNIYYSYILFFKVVHVFSETSATLRIEKTDLKDQLEKMSVEMNKMKKESEKFSEKQSMLEEERDGLREEINQLEISFVEVEMERKRLEESSTNSAELQTILKQTER